MEILYPSNFNASYTFIYYNKVTLYVFIKLHFENTWPNMLLADSTDFILDTDSIKIVNDYYNVHFHYHYHYPNEG